MELGSVGVRRVDIGACAPIARLIKTLNDHDDVQNVYANFEVSDTLMAKLGGQSSGGNPDLTAPRNSACASP